MPGYLGQLYLGQYAPQAGTAETIVALSGVQGTSAVGALLAAFDCGVSGVLASAAAGSLAVTFDVALPGYAGTGAVGTFGVQADVTIQDAPSGGYVPSGDEFQKLLKRLREARASVTVELSGVSARGNVGTLACVVASPDSVAIDAEEEDEEFDEGEFVFVLAILLED